MATVMVQRNGQKFSLNGYADLEAAGIVNVPLAKRKPLAIGRKGNKVVPRNYGLSEADLAALKVLHEAGDELPNPHNKGFSYFLIEALKGLGLNRNHSQKRVIERFRELASAEKDKKTGKTFWQTWKNKESRVDGGRNWLGRFTQNVEVNQRVPVAGRKNNHPYGLKLLRVGQQVLGTKGAVIDVVIGSAGDVMLRLNTDSDTPVNETKKVRIVKTSDTVATPTIEAAPEVVTVIDVTPEVPQTPVEVVEVVEVAAEVVAQTTPEAIESVVETVDAGGGILVDIVSQSESKETVA